MVPSGCHHGAIGVHSGVPLECHWGAQWGTHWGAKRPWEGVPRSPGVAMSDKRPGSAPVQASAGEAHGASSRTGGAPGTAGAHGNSKKIMATGNPGNISGETGTYFSGEVLALAVRSAKYIQGDIHLAEERDGCSRCHTLASVPGGRQSKGGSARKILPSARPSGTGHAALPHHPAPPRRPAWPRAAGAARGTGRSVIILQTAALWPSALALGSAAIS